MRALCLVPMQLRISLKQTFRWLIQNATHHSLIRRSFDVSTLVKINGKRRTR